MKRVLIGIGAAALAVSMTGCSGDVDREGEVEVPASSSSYAGEHYELAVEELADAGFTNIQTEPLGDLVTGWLKDDGELEKIRLDGSNSFSKGASFPADIKIVITYHSFPEEIEEAPEDATEEVTEEGHAPTTEPEQTGDGDVERAAILEQRLKDIFGGVGSMSDLLVEMPADWPGYVVGVRVEGDLAYFTLQVNRDAPDGVQLGQDAARALSTLLSKEDVEGISWLIVEDGARVVIAQQQPAPIL